jgi:hypothetical protein
VVGLAQDLRLALDPVRFAGAVGVTPDAWQRDLLRTNNKHVLLNVSRQAGKSTMSAVIGLHRALFYPGSLVLCLAPALRQSQELFQKIVGSYRDLGRPVTARAEQRLSLELDNGSRIICLPGTERTIRGFSGVDLLLMDEAARVEDGLYYAVRPMLAVSGGSMLMLSTPHGRRGAFFEAWENGGDEWERFRVPAEECPRISPEFLEEERRSMPDFWYRQEYGCEFLDTEDQVFSYELVMGAVDERVTPLTFSDEEW